MSYEEMELSLSVLMDIIQVNLG